MFFKFTTRHWMNEFFRSGSLKLGTIYGYRDTVEYVETQGDALEGQVTHARRVRERQVHTGDRPEALIDEVFKMNPGSALVLHNTTFRLHRHSADGFLFCMTDLCNEDLLRRYRDEWGADACYAIGDPRFFDSISAVVRDRMKWESCAMVRYTPLEEIDYRSELAGAPPALVKREGPFSWQREVRAIWSNLYLPGLTLREQFPSVPQARAFARPIALMEEGDAVRWL